MERTKAEKAISGKRILVVDDEKDVLDTLIDLLQMCKIDTASSFEEGRKLLETGTYDIAILDIMGVEGYELLEIANKKSVPALMLTARALSEKDLKKSAEGGASYYAPKEEMNSISVFVADVLEARDKNKGPWLKWFERLGGYYDRKFGGTQWREKEREFLQKKLGIPL